MKPLHILPTMKIEGALLLAIGLLCLFKDGEANNKKITWRQACEYGWKIQGQNMCFKEFERKTKFNNAKRLCKKIQGSLWEADVFSTFSANNNDVDSIVQLTGENTVGGLNGNTAGNTVGGRNLDEVIGDVDVEPSTFWVMKNGKPSRCSYRNITHPDTEGKESGSKECKKKKFFYGCTKSTVSTATRNYDWTPKSSAEKRNWKPCEAKYSKKHGDLFWCNKNIKKKSKTGS